MAANTSSRNRIKAIIQRFPKDTTKRGCYAFKTTHGKELVELKRTLNKAVGTRGIQLVTISRPTAYGEYAPYSFAKDKQEFMDLVTAMR